VESWSFLTNHAELLLCLARYPGVRLRDLSAGPGITERSVHAIVADLSTAGYIVSRAPARIAEDDDRELMHADEVHAAEHLTAYAVRARYWNIPSVSSPRYRSHSWSPTSRSARVTSPTSSTPVAR